MVSTDVGPRPVRAASGRRGLRVMAATAAIGGLTFVAAASGVTPATASPYYQTALLVRPEAVQRYAITGGYVVVDAVRDRYTTVLTATPGRTGDSIVSSSSSSSTTSADAAYATPAAAQAYAAALTSARGWGARQFSCLLELWNQESSWNMRAENSSSGAYGIPQALPGDKMGPGWQDDYRVQISWGLGYIASVYGDPCGAWASEVSRGSY